MADDTKELVMVPQVEWYKNPTYWAGVISAAIVGWIVLAYMSDTVVESTPVDDKGGGDVPDIVK